MMNKIEIMGRLTRDPELRSTTSGTALASFTLAVDRDYKSQNGERETDFIDCVAWRNDANYVSKHFSKGRMAVVCGRLQSKKWVDNDGNNRTSWEVKVDDIYFGDSKRGDSDGNRPQQPEQQSSSYPSEPYGNEFTELPDDDGELPF